MNQLQNAQADNKTYWEGKATDQQYYTKEERRVIEGSEQLTARANGEVPKGKVTRRDHGGERVVVSGGGIIDQN